MEIKVGYKKSKFSFWTLAFIGVALGLAIVGFSFYFHFEPICTIITELGILAKASIGDPVISWITPYLTPQIIMSGGFIIGTAVVGKIWKNHIDSQKAELEAQTRQAITDNVNMAKSYTDLEAKYSSLQEQMKNPQTIDFEGIISERDSTIRQQADRLKNFEGQMQALSNMANIGESEMVSKLRLMGYEVTKKTVVK